MERIYEITRSSLEGDGELLDSVQLCRSEDASLVRRTGDGAESPLSGRDAVAAIGADPLLAEVSADHDTIIIADPEVAADLPFALTVVAGEQVCAKDEWCVTVNGQLWAPFSTTNGTDRFLPFFAHDEVALTSEWASLSFIETGSMVSGHDTASIGMATATLVVGTSRLDPLADPPMCPTTLWRRGEGAHADAELIVAWLTSNPLQDYLGIDPAMLIQLFLEATLNNPDRRRAWYGDYLAVGTAPLNDVGITESSEWTLRLDIAPEVVTEVLRVISSLGPQMADRVAAARDPASPAGVARRALLDEEGL